MSNLHSTIRILCAILVHFAVAYSLEENLLAQENKIELTPEEAQWLKSNSVIKFTGDPNWLPFEAFDANRNYIGIVADHLELISDISGLQFEFRPTKTWTESTVLAKSGAVDILSETDDSALKSFINFTSSYLANPIVIAMRYDENYVPDINSIKDKKIGLIKDYGYTTKIIDKYKNIEFATVDDIQDGLISVSTGKIDALLCTLALCSYTIAREGIDNVKITGETEFDTRLAFGVNKDKPHLLSILNKSIDKITKRQQQAILDTWINEKYVTKIDYTLAYVVLSASGFLLIIFVFWNRRLKREVKARSLIEKKLEDKTRQLERFLQTKQDTIELLFKEFPIGIAFCDLDGRLHDINQKYAEMLGYTSEEVKALTYWDITPKEYEQQEKEQLRALKDKGSYGPYRKEYICKNKKRIPVELTGFLMEDYNGMKGIFSFVEDISDKIAAEKHQAERRQEVMQNAKLASIGRLAAGIGHEINNPLSIAVGFLNLAKERLGEIKVSDEELLDSLSKVKLGHHRIEQIIGGLRSYARENSGKQEVICTDGVIRQTMDLVSEIYKKEGVHIKLSIEQEHLHSLGNFGELQQVVLNLVNNARDASLGKPKRDIEIRQIAKDSNVIIEIKDHGSGVAKDIQDRIFEPFFTTKSSGDGLGMGLGISKKIIEKMGGSIRFLSTPEGSTFIVSLPLVEAEPLGEPQPELKGIHELPKLKGTSLVVDDEPDIREVLVNYLSAVGLEVDEADDGDTALEKVKLKHYNYIFTDLKMPRMRGEVFVRKAKTLVKNETKFFVITGGVGNNHINPDIEIPEGLADGYITKPFSKKVVIDVITGAIDS